jgi:peptidoglycan hydrolase-like protein with peptidoglycan-binding domain
MSRDEYLRKVQQSLNDQGYDAGKADCKWGPRTSAALRKFQADHGLDATGRIDAQTIAALGITQPAPTTTTGSAESPSKVASSNSSSSSSAQ